MSPQHRFDRGEARPAQAPASAHRRLLAATALVLALCLLSAPSALAAGLGFGGPQVDLNALQCAAPGSCTAIGSYYDGLGHGQAAAWTESGGRWARGVELRAPSNAARNAFDAYGSGGGVSGLSCPSARNCAAVGGYLDAYGNLRAVLFSERAGHWSTTAARMPGDQFLLTHHNNNPTGTAILSGVSCITTGNCLAVGYYVARHGAVRSVMFVQQNWRWGAAITIPVPPGGLTNSFSTAELTAVDCTGGGTCTAVGSYTDGSFHQQGWAVTVSGGRVQSSRKLSMPSGPDTADPSPAPLLTSVSCTGPQDCAAAGNYSIDYSGQNNGNVAGVVLTEQSGSWTATEVQLPTGAAPISTANAQATSPLSVDCPDTGDCSAVGYYTDANSNIQGEVIDYSAGTWGAAQQVSLPGNASTASLSQLVLPGPVSCSAATYCGASAVYVTAVGNYEPLLVFRAGGAWSATPMALPSDAGVDQEVGGLSGISCPAYDPPAVAARNDCSVIGVYQDRWNGIQGFATTEHANGSWGSPVELKVPFPSRTELRLSLSSVLKPGPNTHMRRIAKHHGFRFHYRAVQAGRLSITWRARIGHHRPLIAHALVFAEHAGRVPTWLHLTGYAQRLFRHRQRLRISTRIVFRHRGRRPVVATGTFTLHK